MAIASTLPAPMPPSIACFCSSVPKRLYAPATIMLTPNAPIGAMPRAVSSRNRQRSIMPPPEPP